MLIQFFRQVVSPHSVQQRYSVSGNAKESFNPVLDQNTDSNHQQNLVTSNLNQV